MSLDEIKVSSEEIEGINRRTGTDTFVIYLECYGPEMAHGVCGQRQKDGTYSFEEDIVKVLEDPEYNDPERRAVLAGELYRLTVE